MLDRKKQDRAGKLNRLFMCVAGVVAGLGVAIGADDFLRRDGPERSLSKLKTFLPQKQDPCLPVREEKDAFVFKLDESLYRVERSRSDDFWMRSNKGRAMIVHHGECYIVPMPKNQATLGDIYSDDNNVYIGRQAIKRHPPPLVPGSR